MPSQSPKQSGATLLELILVVAIIAIVSGFSLPVYESFKTKNDLNLGATSAVSAIRRASELARSSDGDTSWGVKFVTSSIIIFKGGAFLARDQNFDEKSDFSTDILVTDANEIVFQKFSGLPVAETTTTLQTSNGESVVIHINSKGGIIY